jgi:hypothetical protein
MIYRVLFLLFFFTGCGSAKIIPTTDVCSVKKHWREHLYQVRINKKKINNHWYLEEDTEDIMKELAKQNKCMAR